MCQVSLIIIIIIIIIIINNNNNNNNNKSVGNDCIQNVYRWIYGRKFSLTVTR